MQGYKNNSKRLQAGKLKSLIILQINCFWGYNILKNEVKNISKQITEKLGVSKEFCIKIDKIMNGQIILFVKHGKINLVRIIEDKMWEEQIIE